MATMLDALELDAGSSVLEIGTGTGYNAALMAEVVGEAGQVITVESRQQVAAEARANLLHSGYERVTVVVGDGFRGYEALAPYDRIIATVGCGEISPHWISQLAGNGAIVAPLEHGGVHPVARLAQGESLACDGAFVGWAVFLHAEGQLAGRPSEMDYALGPTDRWTETTWKGPDTTEILDFWFYFSLTHPGAGMIAVRDDSGQVRAKGAGLVSQDGVVLIGPESLTGCATDTLWEAPVKALADWIRLGAPQVADFRVHLAPKSAPGPSGPPVAWDGGHVRKRWKLDRPTSTETVTLP